MREGVTREPVKEVHNEAGIYETLLKAILANTKIQLARDLEVVEKELMEIKSWLNLLYEEETAKLKLKKFSETQKMYILKKLRERIDSAIGIIQKYYL